MTADQVRQARAHAPFKPFTIFLSDQRRFEIKHPDYLWVLPSGRSIAVAHENGAAEIIDLIHVTSINTNGMPP